MDTANLPRYAAHKEVHALKIAAIDSVSNLLAFHPQDDADPVQVSDEWMTAKRPHVGGYYVIYADGYTSFSPAKAFEEGYTLIKGNGAALTRQQLLQAAIHFKTERNVLRDAVLDYLNFYNAGIGNLDGLEMFAGGLRQPGTKEQLDARVLMGLVDALRPTMDGPGMGGTPVGIPGVSLELSEQPAAVIEAETQPVASDTPVEVKAHVQEREGVKGLFIPADECHLLARSLASLANHAEQTGAYPRLRSAFEQFGALMTSDALVDENPSSDPSPDPVGDGRHFRKNPVVIEAFQWIGKPPFPIGFEALHPVALINADEKLEIKTLEGTMTADDGDWIIKGVKGEFYPCKPDIFAATYSAVTDAPERKVIFGTDNATGETFIGSKPHVGPDTGGTHPHECDRSPAGWRCTREKGHNGPCEVVRPTTQETGWVVEKGDTAAPEYLTFGESGYDFTTDNANGVRFARERDAADAMLFVAGTCGKDLEPMRVAEHSWY